MPKKLKIGIVGCGAIGSSLAKAIVKDFSRGARLYGLYDLDSAKAENLSRKVKKNTSLSKESLEQLIASSELIIEAASARVSWDIARKTLSKAKDVMIMSVGGIATRFKDLTSLARANNARVYIPSGAICGIDALKAARLGKIKKVTLTTIKNPLSFKGVEYVMRKGIIPEEIKKDTVLFSGNARDAVKRFPQNINVAAVLSLAGIGINRTRVRIIASPAATKNTHEIRIESVCGNIYTRTENILHPDNPKTSYLAVLSAIAVLKQILEPVKIGT